jgi:nucleotide-binding universal stress UspA family protein
MPGESTVEHQVVAGYDGSDRARQAVRWAANEAAARDSELTVVDVVRPPLAGADVIPGRPVPPVDDLETEQILRARAEDRLADVAGETRRTWPDLAVRTRAESGRPAEVLARDADRADLLVIGASGRGGLPRILLGSTAAQVLHSATRPVVVVRPGQGPGTGGHRVVVGVDGSSTSAKAIDFAFDFAGRHGGELVAVHAWSDLPMDALEPVRSWDEDWAAIEERGQRLLATSLTGHADRHPGVPVHRRVSLEQPAQALLEHAEHAALLVVGSHGRGTLGSMLLGSVSHAMIYHAPCPVAVVRAP